MIRDRFELLIKAIYDGIPLENPRTRFEMLMSAIAYKIGSIAGGGSSADVIYNNPENTSVVNNGYSLTIEDVTFSDYKYIVIYTTDQAGTNASCNTMMLIDSSAGQRFMGTAGGYYELYFDATNNAIKGNSKYNGQNCIKKIVGVK